MKKIFFIIVVSFFVNLSLAQNISYKDKVVVKRSNLHLIVPTIDGFIECSSDTTISHIFSLLKKKNNGLEEIAFFLKEKDLENTRKYLFQNDDYYSIRLFKDLLGKTNSIILKKLDSIFLNSFTSDKSKIWDRDSLQKELTEKVNNASYFNSLKQSIKANKPVVVYNYKNNNDAYTIITLNKIENENEVENKLYYVMQYISMIQINKNIYQLIRTKTYHNDFDWKRDKLELDYIILKFQSLNK